jgi:3-hydroxybutyryl-CoA dehydrogenase
MQIVVKADPAQKEAFLSKGVPAGVEIQWANGVTGNGTADAYFDLLFEEEGPAFAGVTEKPVFINAVSTTCLHLPANTIRINAWAGFLERELVELATKDQALSPDAVAVLTALGWKYQPVADTPGMIAARVIAMVINEAYFGLGDGISTRGDIDTAMKLGTNYPYGPFEWSEKIGLKKIYALLKKLNETSTRYAIAPALENEVIHQETSKPRNK